MAVGSSRRRAIAFFCGRVERSAGKVAFDRASENRVRGRVFAEDCAPQAHHAGVLSQMSLALACCSRGMSFTASTGQAAMQTPQPKQRLGSMGRPRNFRVPGTPEPTSPRGVAPRRLARARIEVRGMLVEPVPFTPR